MLQQIVAFSGLSVGGSHTETNPPEQQRLGRGLDGCHRITDGRVTLALELTKHALTHPNNNNNNDGRRGPMHALQGGPISFHVGHQ